MVPDGVLHDPGEACKMQHQITPDMQLQTSRPILVKPCHHVRTCNAANQPSNGPGMDDINPRPPTIVFHPLLLRTTPHRDAQDHQTSFTVPYSASISISSCSYPTRSHTSQNHSTEWSQHSWGSRPPTNVIA